MQADDLLALDLALEADGYVVSNDQYRNHYAASTRYRKLIHSQRISYEIAESFAGVPFVEIYYPKDISSPKVPRARIEAP